MSPDSNMPTGWEPLPLLERRILGVLVEKQKTSKSPDTYPLSLNALTTGCNQKSNRDPVMDLDDLRVEDGIEVLQKKGLVMRLTGGRVDRFKHELYEKWTRNGAQMAVLAELLLRGPQTKGELRIRAGRMDPIDSLDALEEVLNALAERGLVVYLTDPDRRGAIVSHGFHEPEELARLKSHHASGLALDEASSPRSAPASNELGELKSRVAFLESQVAELRKQLGLES
jgi:uncharacterized protein